MKTLEINGSLRKELGKKSANKLRKSNNVPCVIYGGKENVHFHTHENSFLHLIYTSDVHLAYLNLDNRKYKTILKDIQYHPVTERILHADFIEVSEDKPIVVSLPVKITGDSIGVKAGGKLNIKKRYLKIRGLIKDIPEQITIDISNLKIHDSVKAGEIMLDNIEILEQRNAMVVNIATSRVAQKTEEAAETAAATGAEKKIAEKASEKSSEEK